MITRETLQGELRYPAIGDALRVSLRRKGGSAQPMRLISPLFIHSWRRLCIDEADGNITKQQYKALEYIKAQFVWCVSGTPVKDSNAKGIVNMIKLIPGTADIIEQLKLDAKDLARLKKCDELTDQPLYLKATRMVRLFNGCFWRVTHAQASLGLPPQIVHERKIYPTSFERQLYTYEGDAYEQLILQGINLDVTSVAAVRASKAANSRGLSEEGKYMYTWQQKNKNRVSTSTNSTPNY
jgi:SNF2-related domain